MISAVSTTVGINLFFIVLLFFIIEDTVMINWGDFMVQDVEPLKPVRAQLASAAKSPEEAFRKMKNKTFVVETKFDGQSSSSLSVL